jgi:hypothetical protein
MVQTDQEADLVPSELRAVAARLKAGETIVQVTVRSLLSWFGAQRRGSQISDWISFCLDEMGLTTEPDFRGAWIDGDIGLLPAETNQKRTAPCEEIQEGSAAAQADTPQLSTASFDPTYRIGRLFAANQSVVAVVPDAEISEAITLMLQRDYSQLPVWVNERNVKGIVTWKSIASRSRARQGLLQGAILHGSSS